MRVAALEAEAGLVKQWNFAHCGHPECAWKLPTGDAAKGVLVIVTGVPRRSCTTGELADDGYYW